HGWRTPDGRERQPAREPALAARSAGGFHAELSGGDPVLRCVCGLRRCGARARTQGAGRLEPALAPGRIRCSGPSVAEAPVLRGGVPCRLRHALRNDRSRANRAARTRAGPATESGRCEPTASSPLVGVVGWRRRVAAPFLELRLPFAERDRQAPW